MTGTYKYVLHSRVEHYLRAGWWVVSLLGGGHADYSVLMKAPVCLEGEP